MATLAKTTGWKGRREQQISNIKIGMESESHPLYGGFCNQGNIENPCGNVKCTGIMTCMMANHCLKGLRVKVSPNERRRMQSIMQ